MTKCTFLCMRTEFIGDLVTGALKNEKLSKLQKNLFLLPYLEFQCFFWNFRNFVIKFYITVYLVIIIIFLFSSNKKREKKN